ncbi:MAG: Rossman fold protein, TIGR00730 family, partial [Acidimicrobiales bacterium]
WVDYVESELVEAGLVSPQDRELYLVTDAVDEAVAEIQRFWRNYHSIRWAGDQLVVRLLHEPTDADVADLNERFGDLLVDGSIERTQPLPAEVSDHDNLDLPRLVMRYEPRKAGRLRALINALNALPSANS